MKKIFVSVLSVFILSFIFSGCVSTHNMSADSTMQLESYYSNSDSDCNFIFEITNQSDKTLAFSNRIFDSTKGRRAHAFSIAPDESIGPGETKVYKYDAYKIIKDFDSSLSIGTHCYEKKWYWWHPISNLQNQRVTVIVTDASKTGGSSINNYYFSNQYKPAYHESTGIENFAVDFSIDDYKKNASKEVFSVFPSVPEELEALTYKTSSTQAIETSYKKLYAISRSVFNYHGNKQNTIDLYIYDKESKAFVTYIKDCFIDGIWSSEWNIGSFVTLVNKSNTVYLVERNYYDVCLLVDGQLWSYSSEPKVSLSSDKLEAGEKVTISAQDVYCKYIMICGCYKGSKWGYDGIIKLLEGNEKRETTITVPYGYDKIKVCTSNDGFYYQKILLEKYITKSKENGRVFKIPSSYETTDLYRYAKVDPRIKIILENKDLDALRMLDPDQYLNEVIRLINSMNLDDYEKVTFIHDFIASLVCYDHDGVYVYNTEVPDDYPTVLRLRKTKCSGYANLFYEMCTRADLVCEIVSGYARGLGWSAKDKVTETNHSWNMVQIKGVWYLVDCTWDAGSETGGVRNEKCSHVWLFVYPKDFIHTHLPLNSQMQMLEKPVSAGEFKKLEYADPLFFY